MKRLIAWTGVLFPVISGSCFSYQPVAANPVSKSPHGSLLPNAA
jgi:hypothetical protein